jgi:hypothetical protein
MSSSEAAYFASRCNAKAHSPSWIALALFRELDNQLGDLVRKFCPQGRELLQERWGL